MTNAALSLVARPTLLQAARRRLRRRRHPLVRLDHPHGDPDPAPRGSTAPAPALLAGVHHGAGLPRRRLDLQGRRVRPHHADTVDEVFGTDRGRRAPGQGARSSEGDDPWADQARVNILLLGSDAGADRIGIRTDSMIVASIDTKTGRTALISMPRNLLNAPLAPKSPLRARLPVRQVRRARLHLRPGPPASAC